jgi:integrase
VSISDISARNPNMVRSQRQRLDDGFYGDTLPAAETSTESHHWVSRTMKPFRDVDGARIRYLEIAEVQRFINGCEPEFRSLARGALETGARYGELGRLEIADFNSNSGTIAIRKSKSGKSRHIVLTEDGVAFFMAHCVGRARSERMFTHTSKNPSKHGEKLPWKKSEQNDPMKLANEHAKLDTSFQRDRGYR